MLWGCEFGLEAGNAMSDGVGELMHANIAGPRCGTRPVGESDHLLARKERTNLRTDGSVLHPNCHRGKSASLNTSSPKRSRKNASHWPCDQSHRPRRNLLIGFEPKVAFAVADGISHRRNRDELACVQAATALQFRQPRYL
jgi:hypothetical protein